MGPSPCFDLTANPGLAFSFLNPRPAYYDLTAIGFQTRMVNLISKEEEVIEYMTDTTDTMSVLEPVSDPMPDEDKYEWWEETMRMQAEDVDAPFDPGGARRWKV